MGGEGGQGGVAGIKPLCRIFQQDGRTGREVAAPVHTLAQAITTVVSHDKNFIFYFTYISLQYTIY